LRFIVWPSPKGQTQAQLGLNCGGNVSAYELGAARRLYKDGDFCPDIIAGVSIGAITSVLLARPAKGMKPVEALEAFWQKIAVAAPFLLPPLRPYASAFGNPSLCRCWTIMPYRTAAPDALSTGGS
jgi:NTE family protein